MFDIYGILICVVIFHTKVVCGRACLLDVYIGVYVRVCNSMVYVDAYWCMMFVYWFISVCILMYVNWFTLVCILMYVYWLMLVCILMYVYRFIWCAYWNMYIDCVHIDICILIYIGVYIEVCILLYIGGYIDICIWFILVCTLIRYKMYFDLY